jgi:hypothetical protein
MNRKTLFFFCAVTQRGPWSLHSWSFYITHNDAPESVGLLWTSYQLVAKTCTWQHAALTRDRYLCPGRIRTRNPSKWAASDPHLRRCGHWDRLMSKCRGLKCCLFCTVPLLVPTLRKIPGPKDFDNSVQKNIWSSGERSKTRLVKIAWEGVSYFVLLAQHCEDRQIKEN